MWTGAGYYREAQLVVPREAISKTKARQALEAGLKSRPAGRLGSYVWAGGITATARWRAMPVAPANRQQPGPRSRPGPWPWRFSPAPGRPGGLPRTAMPASHSRGNSSRCNLQ